MSNELLEFTGRENFDFLEFSKSRYLAAEDINAFKEDCMRINKTHNQMALSQCKLGWQLFELKESKTWGDVINPETGYLFQYESFEAFCKYAFGFSKTKAYALLQISKLVRANVNLENGKSDEVFFIDEKYEKFNTSQLIELASVGAGQRHYFTPEMTVEQMRTVKKYLASSEFWEDRKKEDFDLLTNASNYVAGKKKPQELPAPNVLPGQQSLFTEDIDEDGASVRFPTSGKTDFGEEVDQSDQSEEMSDEYEPGEGEVWQGGGLDRDNDEYDEADEAYEDMQKNMQTIAEDSEKSIVVADPAPQEEVKRYKFDTRDDIRHFLEDYKNWHYRDDFRTPFGKVGYWYTLKTFDIINVLEVHTIDNVSLELECEEIDKPGPIYFLARAKFSDQPSLMVGKRQLENYLMMKRDVLTGRC